MKSASYDYFHKWCSVVNQMTLKNVPQKYKINELHQFVIWITPEHHSWFWESLSGAIWSATWRDLEPSGAIWRHLEPSGAIWNHLEPSGAIWSMRFVLRQVVFGLANQESGDHLTQYTMT